MAWGKVIDGKAPFVNMGHCKICDKLLPLNDDGVCEACVKKYQIENKEDNSSQILVNEKTFLKEQANDNTDVNENKRYMGQCRGCGKDTILSGDGYCADCAEKLKNKGRTIACNMKDESHNNREKEQSNLKPTDEVFPRGTLERKFYSFYKFFHRGSITISIITWIGWLIYFMAGSSQHSTDQYNASQYYLQTGKNLQVATFNAHWNVPVIAAFILILGIFLSYVSAALCKWVEKIEK